MSDAGKRPIVLVSGCTSDSGSANIVNGEIQVKDSSSISLLDKILGAIKDLADEIASAILGRSKNFPLRVLTLGSIQNLREMAINFSSSGDNTVIGSYGSTMKIYKIFLVCATATTITFKDGASVNLTGAITLTAGGSVVLDISEIPWFTITTGNSFIINSTVASQISGRAYFK